MIERLIAKLQCYDALGPAEIEALGTVFSRPVSRARGDVFIREGTELNSSVLLLSGFVHRFKDLRDGRRQSLELSVPGDFVDLHSFTLKRIDHDIGCLTRCETASASHEKLRAVCAEFPHLARLLWLNTTVDAAIHRERIMSLGARSAVERLAHFLCETGSRLQVVGLGGETGFELPLIQNDFAELLGLSLVHTNRTFRELRERGLARVEARNIVIEDWSGLVQLGQFSPHYLMHSPELR